MRKYPVIGLKISSQATKVLVLDECKSASPMRNKVSFLTEPLVSTKGKIFVNSFAGASYIDKLVITLYNLVIGEV
jgi:hypothetical protein